MINGDIVSPLELGYLHKERNNMEWEIVRAIISVLSFAVIIIAGIAGWIAFQKITKNHLHHLDIDLKDVQSDVKANTSKIANIDKNVAVIATKLKCKIEE